MHTHIGFVFVGACLCLANATAQTTHHVGVGQTWLTIDDAIQAASPGDVIAVTAGWYGDFTCSKSVTIRAEPTGAFVQTWRATVQVPAGGHTRFCGLHMLNVAVGAAGGGAGVVSFESCEMTNAFFGTDPALTVNGTAVSLWRCRLANAAGGILAYDARLAIVQCDISSGASSSGTVTTLSALDLRQGSRAHVASSTLAAGAGSGYSGAWPGIFVLGMSAVDVVDSTVRGGDYTAPSALGGPAIQVGATATSALVRQARCSLIAGAGPGGLGPIAIPAVLPTGDLLGVGVAESVVSAGGSVTADFQTTPATPVYVLAGLGLKPPAWAALATPLQWGFTAPNGVVLGVVVTGGTGTASYGLSIPPHPALRDTGVWITGVGLGHLPTELSPPVGGVIR
jgi:nitrous oxidase accessory protein NosD